jgi:hypothetical protein
MTYTRSHNPAKRLLCRRLAAPLTQGGSESNSAFNLVRRLPCVAAVNQDDGFR